MFLTKLFKSLDKDIGSQLTKTKFLDFKVLILSNAFPTPPLGGSAIIKSYFSNFSTTSLKWVCIFPHKNSPFCVFNKLFYFRLYFAQSIDPSLISIPLTLIPYLINGIERLPDPQYKSSTVFASSSPAIFNINSRRL